MINTIPKDFGKVEAIPLKMVAEILGLKYHHTRKILLNTPSIGYYDYGGKRLWNKEDVLEYKRKHYIKGVSDGDI